MKFVTSLIVLLCLIGNAGAQINVFNMTDTWNAAGTVFNAIKMDITDTSSAAGSSALWLGFAGAEAFRVDKSGDIQISGSFLDAAGLELLKFSRVGSAVNEITIANAATLAGPVISATGDGADVPLLIDAKGAGDLILQTGSTGHVGIETQSPGGTLPNSFNGTQATVLELRGRSTTTDAGVFIRDGDDTPGLDLWTDGSSGFSFIDSRWDAPTRGLQFRVRTAGTPIDVMLLEGSGHVGIGIAPASGLEMGNDLLFAKDVNADLTAGTTQTQGEGLALTAQVNEVSTVANPNDTVVLPALPATGSLQVEIINNGANTIRVFPASGDDLGAGADTADAVNIPTGTVRKYISYDATNWVKYISE